MQTPLKTIRFPHFFFLWFGAAVSMAEILAGGLLAPLGFEDGLLAILGGHALGTILLVLCGLIGFREGLSAIESTRISFGVYGAKLFSLFNILQLVGWTSIMILAAARSLNETSRHLWQIDQYGLWCLLVGALVLLWIVLGRETGWKKANMAAALLLFALTIVMSSVVFADTTVLSKPAAGGMPFGAGFELSVVMPLSWLPLIADYTRFARSGQGAAWGSGLGYFLGSCWMYIIGLSVALVAGQADPAGMLLAANLGLSVLAIVLLATITTTFMDAYSAGVSVHTLLPGFNEKHAALAVTVAGTLLALGVDMEQYEGFLLLIGSVFAPLFAILLSDYFLLGNRQLRPGLMVNWLALVIWALGVALYYQLLKLDLVIGATVPVMFATAFTYILVGRFAAKWSLQKDSLKTSA